MHAHILTLSTGALVTGLTEKLNQKRMKSAMDISSSTQLEELQLQGLLGEGGFAKVGGVQEWVGARRGGKIVKEACSVPGVGTPRWRHMADSSVK